MAKITSSEIGEKESVSGLDKGLTWEDLVLVLESYKNMIALNTTLLDQQRKINEGIGTIVEKQVIIHNELKDAREKIKHFESQYETRQTAREVGAASEMSRLYQEHAQLASKLNLVYVAFATIVVGLVGLVVLLLTHMTK